MYVIGYTLANPSEDQDPNVVFEEWEIFAEFRSSFYRMIEDKKDDATINDFFWGIKTSPDEYDIGGYHDKPL